MFEDWIAEAAVAAGLAPSMPRLEMGHAGSPYVWPYANAVNRLPGACAAWSSRERRRVRGRMTDRQLIALVARVSGWDRVRRTWALLTAQWCSQALVSLAEPRPLERAVGRALLLDPVALSQPEDDVEQFRHAIVLGHDVDRFLDAETDIRRSPTRSIAVARFVVTVGRANSFVPGDLLEVVAGSLDAGEDVSESPSARPPEPWEPLEISLRLPDGEIVPIEGQHLERRDRDIVVRYRDQTCLLARGHSPADAEVMRRLLAGMELVASAPAGEFPATAESPAARKPSR